MSEDNNVTKITTTKQIHDLTLHETLQLSGAIVTRVPGGWLYSMIEMMGDQQIILPPTFVPYSDEFKRKI